uniref:Transmembrane protein n=1 Tax=Opuntia streptacantha TaxID=393608 RepID=A0A7C9A1I8_OPUST
MMPGQYHNHNHHHHQQQSGVLYELSSLILNILRSPPSPAIHLSDHLQSPSPSSSEALAPRRGAPPPQITPSGFASLMLGISLALMLCGSVTFFIGFMLLPWVVGLVMVFYFVGLVSSLSVLGRAFLCYAMSPSSPPSPRKDIPAWKLL